MCVGGLFQKGLLINYFFFREKKASVLLFFFRGVKLSGMGVWLTVTVHLDRDAQKTRKQKRVE